MYYLKRIVIKLLVSIVLMLFLIIPTFASSTTYKLDELGLEVSIPSTYDVITRDTPVSSPIFKELGVSGKELIEQFKTTFIYLNAIPKGVTGEEIVVTMAPNDINNFSALSATSLKMVASSWITSLEEFGISILKYDIYEHSQAKFVRIYFEDTINSAYGLQYYTIYDSKAINFTMRSYSGGITSTQEQAIKNIVDTIKFDTPPVEPPSGVETEAFIYTDTKTNTKFTVPANWYEKELSKERDTIDVKFVSSKEEGMTIMYGSVDVWEALTDDEKVGATRSDISNDAFTIDDIAELYGIDKSKVSMVEYNGIEYFQFTFKQTTELYGIEFSPEMTILLRFENGWMYSFQFGGTTDSIYFDDLEALLNSVEYAGSSNVNLISNNNDTSANNANHSAFWGVVVVVLLLGIVAVAVWYVRKNKEDENESSSKPNKCTKCGVELTNDSLFCHICGARNEIEPQNKGDD